MGRHRRGRVEPGETSEVPAVRATVEDAVRPRSAAMPARGVSQGAPRVTGRRPDPPQGGMPGQRRRGGPGPREEYLAAFDDDDVFAAGAPVPRKTEEMPSGYGPPPGTSAAPAPQGDSGKGRLGRTMTGIAAAAMTTVLAVVVAGQVTTGESDGEDRAAGGGAGSAEPEPEAAAVPAEERSEPAGTLEAAPLRYERQMAEVFPLDPTLRGSGKLSTVAGRDKASGSGRKVTYRVDVEDGLNLDGELFAQAVHRTLTDKRSWSNDGARSFERVSSGDADFVMTLASPGTTALWCAKSGLDTTQDNVSCDSASTERVMINAYRWAQGARTFGDDKIYAYRQMLINHEVGHRLGFGHVRCPRAGAPAPVMMQQTKYLKTGGVTCRPNAWPHPNG